MRYLSSHCMFLKPLTYTSLTLASFTGSHHWANHWAEPPLMRFNFRSVDDKKSFLQFYISISNELTTASNPVILRILVEDEQMLYPSAGVTGVERLLFELAAELINNIIHGDGALQLAYLVKLEEHPPETDVQCIKSILQWNPLTFIVLSAPTLALEHRVLFSSSDIIKSENCISHAAQLFVPSEPLRPSNDTSSSFENNNIQGLPAELELVTPFQTLCRAYCLPTE
ncbi:uncharacterized protein EV420DRAFT_1160248 [Desarmillaria tabescens]|uniref:Uncharacterized protein n=1 Tax=Armillaria tabescens TaxID=1929756 RepID=A0AA39NCM7_ARMTA|nr:uncharacterized protein EV420DRAFT_1160248 [Desarmillaria tabescens]KAK0463195.1 hypothetical protein EV420DRAFT_1160248 [Desarmillaria tabescens]